MCFRARQRSRLGTEVASHLKSLPRLTGGGLPMWRRRCVWPNVSSRQSRTIASRKTLVSLDSLGNRVQELSEDRLLAF